jgi:hypothetical protein
MRARHLARSLVDLRMEHKGNRFMGCDYNIALLHWELKSGLGLGEHQVSGDTKHSEKSVGNRGAGLFVGAAGVSSRDCSWQTLEYFSVAACATVTGHDEPSRAHSKSKDGKDS